MTAPAGLVLGAIALSKTNGRTDRALSLVAVIVGSILTLLLLARVLRV